MGILQRIIKTIKDVILISLMLISFIWGLVYIPPYLSTGLADFIYSNPIFISIWLIYYKVYPPLLGVLVSIFNVINAVMGLYKIIETKDIDKKRFVLYLLYSTISFGIFIFNYAMFDKMFRTFFSR